MIIKKISLVCVFFLSLTALFSAEVSLVKKIYNVPFNGGKEIISYLEEGDIGSISILSKNVYIDLYENYSKVRVLYVLKNNVKSSINIRFLYPKMDIDKNNIKSVNGVESKMREYISGDYNGFIAKVDEKFVNVVVKDDTITEPNIPIKTEHVIIKSSTENPDNIHMENTDSFVYEYGFYSVPIAFLEKDKIEVEFSYITKHYYNDITSTNFQNSEKYEEPSLKYCYYNDNETTRAESDKLFFYSFWTDRYFNNGGKEDSSIKNLSVELRSHVIDNEYLNISPKNYKQKKNLFIWKYSDFIPRSINNIIVCISSENEHKAYPRSLFDITPDIIPNPYENLYKLDRGEDLTIQYREDKEINISEIRFSPKIHNNKYDVREANNPLLFEISFFDKSSIDRPILVTEKSIKSKAYFDTIKKRSYITIFKDKPVKCNLIKIKILDGSIPYNDIFYIGNIQLR